MVGPPALSTEGTGVKRGNCGRPPSTMDGTFDGLRRGSSTTGDTMDAVPTGSVGIGPNPVSLPRLSTTVTPTLTREQ